MTKGTENASEEVTAEDVPNLEKERDFQLQEARRVPHRINPDSPALRHAVMKMAKVKERIPKTAREQSHYKGAPRAVH